MNQPRRQFLWCAGATVSGIVLVPGPVAQSPRSTFPKPPPPAERGPSIQDDGGRTISHNAAIREHEKEFRNCLARLADRVSQLKTEVESLNTSGVFSVRIFKQSDEIEQLAKQLKALAKT